MGLIAPISAIYSWDGSKYYEFVLDDTKNPIILTGPNGFGKTTFFDAIELVFSNKITRFNEAIEKGNTVRTVVSSMGNQ